PDRPTPAGAAGKRPPDPGGARRAGPGLLRRRHLLGELCAASGRAAFLRSAAGRRPGRDRRRGLLRGRGLSAARPAGPRGRARGAQPPVRPQVSRRRTAHAKGRRMIPNHGPSLEFGLGETADAIRETTARFAADKIAPLAAEIDETNAFPRQLWPQMGELGLHGVTVEEDYGGLGLGYLEHVVAMEEVS